MTTPSGARSDVELSEAWLDGLFRLNAVIAATGSELEGNLCYPHRQRDFSRLAPDPVLRPKRDRLRAVVAGRRRMVEIGVNGGHSAYIALTANEALEFHGVDICDWPYVRPVMAFLATEFPGRVHFHPGNCLTVLPRLARQGLRADLFHIDGAKITYYEDVLHAQAMRDGDDVAVVLDDAQLDLVQHTWARCLRHGLVAPLEGFGPMDRTERYQNQIGRLLAPVWWRRPAYLASARGRVVARRARKLAQHGWWLATRRLRRSTPAA